MKRNLYDVFDHWNDDLQELPPLREQPIDGKRVSARVLEQIGVLPQQKRKKSFRLFGVVAAAAVLTCGTVTVSAVSGKMDAFFSAISGSDLRGNPSEDNNLPGVGDDATQAAEQMQGYYSCPEVSFTENDSASVELLGMYNDHNSLMLSLQLNVKDGTVLPEDASLLPYYTLRTADGETRTPFESGHLSENLRKSETEENVYYMTCYLLGTDLAGSVLQVQLDGVYDDKQEEAAYETVIELQDSWHETYFTEDMSIEEWKAFWKEQNFDQQTQQAYKDAYASMTPLLDGGWTAEIPIAEPASVPVTAETDGVQVVIDDLSVCVRNAAADESDMPYVVVYLKDGTILADDFFMFDEKLPKDAEGGYVLDGTPYQYFAYTHLDEANENGVIFCYSKPVLPSEVEKVEAWTYDFDEEGNALFSSSVLYQAG